MNAQAAEEQPRRKQRRWDSRSQNGEENRNQRSRSPKKPGTRQRRTSRRSSCLYSDEDLEARRSRPSRSREFRHREERRAERRWNREERKRRIDDEAGNRHYKRRRRKRRSNSPSGSNPSVKNNARTGVVSIEEERPIKTEHSSSFHDDTIGHYKCGKGAIIDDRYRVEREVGLGTFGRVLECTDLRKGGFRSSRSGQVVAIKVVRNQKRYYESALLEAKIIAEINRKGGRGLTHCVVMHDAFTFRGHYCMVFESLGPSLYDFLKRHNYQGFPIFCVEDFAMQLLEACEFLHRNRIIHTDLKLENILLMNDREVHRDGHQVPESSRIKLIDFGGACYDDEKKSSIINTRQYRSPEVIFGVGWSMPSDMWSIACILVEIYRGELLFPTHNDLEHLALIEHILGPFPHQILRRARSVSGLVDEAFNSNGRHRLERVLERESASFVEASRPLGLIVRNPDHSWFLNLLRMILVVDVNQRATAHECLQYLERIRRGKPKHTP